MMKRFPLTLAAAAALVGCGDGSRVTPADASSTDATSSDATFPVPDAADTTAADTTPVFSPRAAVYRVDPLSTPALTEVTLEHLTSADHSLAGDFARVRSCTPDLERGKPVSLEDMGFPITITPCTPEHKAFPGADQTYLGITPPATPAVDDGRFAEVMMYHHMQVIHDYFKLIHNLSDRDEPLDAVTNVQAYVDLCDEWTMIANAAFFPAGTLDQIGIDLDLDLDGDAIVFSGSSKRNFSFDAAVIYHEYTHAMLGATRLSGVFSDAYGINNLPGALNEAYADYFAATVTDQSAIGNYALNDFEGMKICGFELGGAGNLARDLENLRTCPNDLTAEVHADSEMFSSALWAVRKALGPTLADKIVLQSVLTLTQTSDFDAAVAATLDAAQTLGEAEAYDAVHAAFSERGLIGCLRVLPIDRVGARGLGLTLESPEAFQLNPFPGYAPGYLQLGVEVPANTTKITINLTATTGGFMGSGGEPAVLDVLFKPGGDPVRYRYGMAAGSATHDATAAVTVTDGKATLTLDAPTSAPTRWVLALHNRGAQASLTAASATLESATAD